MDTESTTFSPWDLAGIQKPLLGSDTQALAAEIVRLDKRADQLRDRLKDRKFEELERYANDPVGFAVDVLEIPLLDIQRNYLRKLASGDCYLGCDASCWCSKELTAAIAVLWFTTCRRGIVVTVHSTFRGSSPLWRRVRQIFNHERLPGKVSSGRSAYDVSQNVFALAANPRNTSNVAGLHHEGPLLLVWYDRLKLPPELIDQLEGLTGLTGTHQLIIEEAP